MDSVDLVKQLEAVKAEKISLLGEGECFVRKTSKGFVQSVKVAVHLHESKGEIYSIGNKWCISADGYDKLNQAAGLSVVAPGRINHGTEFWTGNPHFEFDVHKQNLKSVTVRRIVVGPSPIGNLVAIERILRFDVDLYFLEDLQSKVKSVAGCGGYGTQEVKPSHLNESSAVKFDLGPAALWVDVSHVEIQDAFREHVKRCKYAERIAIRMCERNAFASHPAIARRQVEPVGGVAIVPVFGGRSVVDEERLEELVKIYAEGDGEVGKFDEIEMVPATEVEAPTLEEVSTVSVEDELAPKSEEKPKSEWIKVPKKTRHWKAAAHKIQQFAEEHPGDYWAAIDAEDIKDWSNHTTQDLNKFIKKYMS